MSSCLSLVLTRYTLLPCLDCGILTHVDSPGDELRKFTWRQSPLTFATKLQPPVDAVTPATDKKSAAGSAVGSNSSISGQSSTTAAATSAHSPWLHSTLLVAGSATTVDIWSLDTGKIVHIFETKKDRIKSLEFLFVRNRHRLYLLADEEKDGVQCSSIISVYQDYATASGNLLSVNGASG